MPASRATTTTGSVPSLPYGSTETKSGPVSVFVLTIGDGPVVSLVTASWTTTFGTARIAAITCASRRLSATGGHGTRNSAVPPVHGLADAATRSVLAPASHRTGPTKHPGPQRRRATGRADPGPPSVALISALRRAPLPDGSGTLARSSTWPSLAVTPTVSSPSRVASRTTGPTGGGGRARADVSGAPGRATDTSRAVTASTAPSRIRSARAGRAGCCSAGAGAGAGRRRRRRAATANPTTATTRTILTVSSLP